MKGLLLDDNNEIQVAVVKDADGLITQGMVVGDITFQNQNLIIAFEKGELREAPGKGVGASTIIDDESPDDFVKAIRIELANEGMKVNAIGFNEDNDLKIDANY